MTASAKVKPMRKAGEVPADYHGPVYWRLSQYGANVTGHGGEPIVFEKVNERNGRRLGPPRGKTIYTSGDVFDENGNVFPEWREPRRARWTTDKPVRVEYSLGIQSARVSERVLEAIEALEPRKHWAFPIDVYAPNGRVDRRYHLFFAQDSLLSQRELHLAANGLTPIPNRDIDAPSYHGARFGEPAWMMPNHTALYHQFGYLDRSIVGDRHWFQGTAGNHIFSPSLFAALEPMGDIFLKWEMALPMGIV